jgi:hypothetical protein
MKMGADVSGLVSDGQRFAIAESPASTDTGVAVSLA